MELEILGGRGGCPLRDNPCPGYLVRSGETQVLLDCGPGVAGRVWPLLHARTLDAILLSHLHGDHMLDLVPLVYALGGEDTFAQPAWEQERVPLWVPPGGAGMLRDLAELMGFGGWARSLPPEYTEGQTVPLWERYFAIHEYDGQAVVQVGGLAIHCREMPHTVPSFALRIVDAGGTVLVYSGDVADGTPLAAFATGCDLLLCEASAVIRDTAFPAGHISAEEAGAAATAGGARALVLTHVIPYDATEEQLTTAARRTYDGPVRLALPQRRYQVGGSLLVVGTEDAGVHGRSDGRYQT